MMTERFFTYNKQKPQMQIAQSKTALECDYLETVDFPIHFSGTIKVNS